KEVDHESARQRRRNGTARGSVDLAREDGKRPGSDTEFENSRTRELENSRGERPGSSGISRVLDFSNSRILSRRCRRRSPEAPAEGAHKNGGDHQDAHADEAPHEARSAL